MQDTDHPSGSTLLQRARKGVFWVGIVTLGSKGMSVITTLILARILTPEDFGLMGIATIVIAALAIFTDLGLGAAIIHSKADRQRMASTAFFMMPVIGLTIYALAFFSAPSLAAFLGDASATDIIRLVALNIVIASLTVVPSVLLEKDMAYRRKAIPDLAPTLVYIVVALVLAKGFSLGAYSIAIALVVQALTGLVLNWLFVRWRPSLIFDRHIAAQLLGYSKHVLGGSVIVYLATNMDNTFVSRSSGVAALGLYVMAYNIANMPATQVADVIGRVLFPSFVELNDDPERLRRAYVRSLKILIVIAFPLLAGLAAVAAPFVTVVMGAKWLPIIGVLQILIIFTAFRVVSGATGSLFLATGHTRFILWSGIAGLLLQAAFLTLAVVWLGGGIIGASWAVSLASVINGVFIATWVNKVVPFSWFDLLEPAIRLVTPSVLMGLVVFALSLALPLEWWALGLEVMVGAALYALFVLTILGRSFIADMVRLVRKRPA